MTTDKFSSAAWRRWCIGHWAFFVLIQGMIAVLSKLVRAIDENRWDDARCLLDSLSELLHGSAAAMQFASDFSPTDYETDVRPTMEPPATVDGFSGLLSRDHKMLVKMIQKARPQLARARETLPEQYAGFLDAHKAAMAAHVHVCRQFGGDNGGSLRMSDSSSQTAVDVLLTITKTRSKMIDENTRKC